MIDYSGIPSLADAAEREQVLAGLKALRPASGRELLLHRRNPQPLRPDRGTGTAPEPVPAAAAAAAASTNGAPTR